MSKVDKNKRLCSSDIQSRIGKALDVIDSESLTYAVLHNSIELWRLEHAIKLLKELVTNKRSHQLYNGGVIK